jgi:hypothetical protein
MTEQVLKILEANRHTDQPKEPITMQDTNCRVPNCQAKPYAPAGTESVCRDHFLQFLTWRRRRGPQMFLRYAGMTMEERDTVATEWIKTIRIDEVPSLSQANP